MAESDRRLSLAIPWSTLLKVIAAVGLVAVLLRIWYILTLILVAIIVAVGLYPPVVARGGRILHRDRHVRAHRGVFRVHVDVGGRPIPGRDEPSAAGRPRVRRKTAAADRARPGALGCAEHVGVGVVGVLAWSIC